MSDDRETLDECMPALPRDDDTVAVTAIDRSAHPVATPAPIDGLAGMRLLADMASAIHHVDPKEREEVLRSMLTACAVLDCLDPMRDRGLAITVAGDMRWIISFIDAPALGPVILDPTTGVVSMVECATGGGSLN